MSHDAIWGIVAKLGTRAIQRRWLHAHAMYGCWMTPQFLNSCISKLLIFINSKNLRTIRKWIVYENFQDYSIARRKKNFLLLRSWMEVDDRVNVSNQYSKKHDARHSCTFAKALKTPPRPLARIMGGGSKRVTLSGHWTWNQKPRSCLLKSSNGDSADSNEVLLERFGWRFDHVLCPRREVKEKSNFRGDWN